LDGGADRLRRWSAHVSQPDDDIAVSSLGIGGTVEPRSRVPLHDDAPVGSNVPLAAQQELPSQFIVVGIQ
jgi:hypothetical protein